MNLSTMKSLTVSWIKNYKKYEEYSSPEFEKADNSDYWYPIQARDKTDFLVISLPSVNENPFCKKVYGLV